MRKRKNHTFRPAFFLRVATVILPLLCLALVLSQTASAQNTYVITDGNRVLIHTTYATDPAAVLNEAGFQLGNEDTYTTQQGDGVSEITVRRVQTVYINHCGENLAAGSYGETVGELLERLDLDVTGDTVMSASPEELTYDGMQLTISRTVQVQEQYTRQIPYETVYCEDPSMPVGTTRVLIPGSDGEMLCQADVIYKNSQEVGRVETAQTVTVHPVQQVVAVGTGEEPQPQTEPQGLTIQDGMIVTENGDVLTYTHTMTVVATAYNNTNEGCDEITATGTIARVGAIAVDPRVIPYGTRMFIVSNDGEYVYGIATAEDCGGGIKGNRIDLYYDTNYECFQFGVRRCTIYFLG